MSETLAGYLGWAIFIFMAAFWLVIEIAYRRRSAKLKELNR
jgi:hypothetical protein